MTVDRCLVQSLHYHITAKSICRCLRDGICIAVDELLNHAGLPAECLLLIWGQLFFDLLGGFRVSVCCDSLTHLLLLLGQGPFGVWASDRTILLFTSNNYSRAGLLSVLSDKSAANERIGRLGPERVCASWVFLRGL